MHHQLYMWLQSAHINSVIIPWGVLHIFTKNLFLFFFQMLAEDVFLQKITFLYPCDIIFKQQRFPDKPAYAHKKMYLAE